MRNITPIYKALLMLYPRRYQEAFSAEMMQTLLDQYQDTKASEGHVNLSFWLATLADELKNITRQHLTPLREETTFLGITASKLTVSAALLFPLYALFYGALVKVSLALPHPHVSGVGVILALATLLLLPGVLSLVTSYVIASVVANALPKRNVEMN